jgi:hypothetical protein
MPLVKPQAQPGIVSQASQVQAQGAWFAGNRVRWRYGFLEKMGGWQRLIEAPFLSLIRRMHAWTDLENYKNLFVASDLGLQIIVNDTQYTLGQQFSLISTLTTFSVTTGSTLVTVNVTLTVTAGQDITFLLPISIGGQIIPAGSTFPVVAPLTTVNGFTFNMPNPALTTEVNVVGVPLLTNNIVNGITVTWKNHGFVVGQTFHFDQTTTLQSGVAGSWEKVNFVAVAGTGAVVASVVDADHFTFGMGTDGFGDGAGGSDHLVWDGGTNQTNTGTTTTTAFGNVIGVASLLPLGNPQRSAWFLDNLGETGLVLQTNGSLQVFNPPIENGQTVSVVGAGAPATAPQHSNGMFVTMPQAQVVLFGTEPILATGEIDPLLVRWSDAGTFDSYTATVANQAGSYRLSRGSEIRGGIQAPQTTLLITDVDIWSMSYIGPPLIYGFTVMGTGCGLVAPHAIATLAKTTFWLSLRNVWSFGDSGIQPVPCSVWDFIFENLDEINIKKCHAAANSTTGEVAFFFPPKSLEIELEQNILVVSQDFSAPAWVKVGGSASTSVQFTTGYVYDVEYLAIDWFDLSGLGILSWLDGDCTTKPTSVVVGPNGTFATTIFLENTTNGLHQLSQQVLKAAERELMTFSLYVHKASTRNVTLRVAGQHGSAFVTFDVVHGVEVTSGAVPPFKVTSWGAVTDKWATGLGTLGNGWLRYFMVFQTDDSDTSTVFINLTNGTQISYLGTNQYAYIFGAQLGVGSELLDYKQTGGTNPQNETVYYIKYNTMENAWDSGQLARSAWIDNSIWGTPLGGDENFRVQQHERGFDADDQPMEDVFIESGFTELGDGTQMMSVHQCHPDFKWFGNNNGEVKVSLKMKNYPNENAPEFNYGPFSMTSDTQFFNPRARGRYVAIRYDWAPLPGFSARLGAMTYRVKPTGRRP